MGSVVALEEFRQSLRPKNQEPARPPRPEVSGASVWGRDYREVESVVYGLLQARGLVAHHVGEHDPDFDHLCMNALEAAYRLDDLGQARLNAAIRPLKEWILDVITEDNKRDLSWSLVLLDLIEKSPAR
jgi:hypothetical protein